MIDERIQTRRVAEDMAPNSHAPPGRKHRSQENRKAVWSLWAMVHWMVFASITLSVIYLVVLLR